MYISPSLFQKLAEASKEIKRCPSCVSSGRRGRLSVIGIHFSQTKERDRINFDCVCSVCGRRATWFGPVIREGNLGSDGGLTRKDIEDYKKTIV